MTLKFGKTHPEKSKYNNWNVEWFSKLSRRTIYLITYALYTICSIYDNIIVTAQPQPQPQQQPQHN